jgi:ATP-dependent helicase HrpB
VDLPSRLISLPIDPFVPGVIDALRCGRDVVLVAEPGAGKTTRIAPAIVRSGLLERASDQVLMLQPRRVAARASASRIAEEQGWRLGEEIGYQVRFERVMGPRTPLRVLTEGILVRRMVADPELAGVSCVILDEFHERSIHSDLSLAMLREAKSVRPGLRLVVMSATLDADAVAEYLRPSGAVEIFHAPGRLFPVEVEYAGDSPLAVEARVADSIARFIATAGGGGQGDVLVFLPGAREIERVMRQVGPIAARHGYDVLPLHGSLAKEEQDRAVRFDPAGPPRVICATNIAETSLTLPGVRLVIDSGLVRQAGYDANRGVDTLSTVRISKASAEQRRGRAGRVAEGRCVRLWSKMTHHRLADFDVAEIRRVDLCQTSLAVRAWGGDPLCFSWFEPPDRRLLESSGRLLEMLGAVKTNRLTALGRNLQSLPVHPRAARLVMAAPAAMLNEAATLAALLAEAVEVPGRRTANIRELLEAFSLGRLDPVVGRAVERGRDALIHSAFSARREPSRQPSDAGRPAPVLEELLLLAYPDRVCRRRVGDPASARLVEGGGVRLPDPSAVRGDLFLALDVRRGMQAQAQQADVHLVAEIEEWWLDRYLPESVVREETATYDEGSERVVQVRRRRYRDLVLAEERGGKPDWQEAETILRNRFAGEDAWKLVTEDDVLGDLYRRWRFLVDAGGEKVREQLPLPAPAALIGEACAGSVAKADIIARARAAAEGLLRGPGNLLDRWAPGEVVAPSGSRIRLQWPEPGSDNAADGRPVLAVRIQELFGLSETPRVGPPPGVPVTLQLLGPNFRPVQITSDLKSFWKNTYPQVRKDLRARYPKHAWPENPAGAEPMRGARRRNERS